MIKVFLDTNTIVHWAILKKGIERHGEGIIKKYRKLEQSYRLVEGAINEEFKAEFYTSNLVLAEMTRAFADFLISEKMRSEGIAAIYWAKYFKDFLLTDEEFDEFIDAVIKLSNLIRERLNVIEDEVFEVEYYPFFVARAGLMTQDAIILTTAIKSGMNYFVTMDRDFHELIKDKRLRRVKEFFKKRGFEIVKPKRMMQILEGLERE
ncbi:PIN domain-containing protein [Thermococcus barophilus]|uniref:PIN domain-containing protein n=1 Tax=Thermococcus barophilus TaxID=55802 RepID=A0A0S1X8C2_THEBA|nr:PIN domain-containing protein [Thermococcus barophilus]ALM74007.1 hypothetical protein TBCH5v1_0027 [Thermococcus barophilus]